MGDKSVGKKHRYDRISREFVLSQYSVVLKTLKDEELPEAMVTLELQVRQLIILTAPEERFFNDYVRRAVSQSFKEESNLVYIKGAFQCLRVYCENLVKMFWKNEVKTVKRYTGVYKNLQNVLPDIDCYLKDIGYEQDDEKDMLELKPCRLLDMERIMKLGFDWFLSEVLVEYLENVFYDLKPDGYSWKQVTEQAINFVGTEEECLRWFRERFLPESKLLQNGTELRYRISSNGTNGRVPKVKEDAGLLYGNSKGASKSRLPSEGVDPSYGNVEQWLKDSLPDPDDSHNYHQRQIEHHKETARQREMALKEEETRRQYIDMKKQHQFGSVSPSFGDQLKFDPIDNDYQNKATLKTSQNLRKKFSEKLEDMPIAVPKVHRDKKGVTNMGANRYNPSIYSSGTSNGHASSSRSSNPDTKVKVLDERTKAEYFKYLEGDPFDLNDDEEDLYSGNQACRVPSKLPLKPDSFVMVGGKDAISEIREKPRRPLSAVHTHQYAYDQGLRDLSGDLVSHDISFPQSRAKVPDVYSTQRTQEDHMKNSMRSLGLESGASSIDHGFDDWEKDYKERDEASKESKHSDLDWARYKNLQAAAQDYLGSKTDALLTGEKDIYNFDIPSLDIRRPPGASDYGIGEDFGKESKLDSIVEPDGLLRHSTTGYPSLGVTGRSVNLPDKTDTKRATSLRNSVHLPLNDLPALRTGKFPSFPYDDNRRHTLASQAAGADLTRPEYASVLKESLKGVKMHSDFRNSGSYATSNRSSVSKSLTDESKRDWEQYARDKSIHYATLPASSVSRWKCTSCKHDNSTKEICAYCKRGRETVKNWQCKDCTYLNPPERDVCRACDRSRTKGSEKDPLAVGGLECPKCTYINPTGAKKCEICDDPLIVYAVHI